MNLQKLFLRFMLVSLALTAVIGVIVVLFEIEGFGMRAVATTCTTTVASGVLARLAVLRNRTHTKTAGLFGMGVVVTAYVLAVPLIWWNPPAYLMGSINRPSSSFAYAIYEALTEMVIWILLAGLLAFLSLLLHQISVMRGAARVGLGLSGGVFVLLLLGTWLPDETSTRLGHREWRQTALLTAIFGALIVGCIPKLFSRYWPGVGIIAAVVAWGTAVFGVFAQGDSQSGEIVVTICTSIAILVAYMNVLLFLPIPGGTEWVRGLAFCTAVLTAIGLDVLLLRDIYGRSEELWNGWVGRGTGAAAIITGCDTVALLVLAAIERFGSSQEESSEYDELSLDCPKCSTHQTVNLGKSSCSACGLGFSIKVKETQAA